MKQDTFVARPIPYQLLNDLHDNYIANKHKFLTTHFLKQETKSIWFSIDDIQHFLDEIRNDTRVSGIRMYFIQYPERQTEMYGVQIPPDVNDVNQLSIALVTTKEEGTSRHPDYPESESSKLLILAAPYNHGQLCPTKCNS